MQQQKMTVEDIVQRLREKFSANIKNPKKQPMGQIFFCSRSVKLGLSNSVSSCMEPLLYNFKAFRVLNSELSCIFGYYIVGQS
jgi:hypothetical protein